MKTISAALKAHLAQPYQTMATLWLVVRKDGSVYGFTDHDQPITYNLATGMTGIGLTAGPGVAGTGSVTYSALAGFTPSTIQTALGLNVDTGQAQGVLVSPAITEADLLAGLWDYARITIFELNWADTTMGPLLKRSGHIGEATTGRGTYTAEWRGLMQYYQTMIGRLTSPFCDAVLGDTRCGKNLTTFTVTGTVDSALSDNMTIFDAARTEPGPSGGISITSISNANPGHVVMASAGSFKEGDAVTLSGCGGMLAVNGTTFIRNLSGTGWDLGVDTTNTSSYPAYSGGGTVTPLGGGSGYFDGGKMTITSGANSGLSMEVKSYVPGQWVLTLPLPYTIAVGVTYSMVAGCDHSFATCRDTFSNAVNFRGLPYLPGIDKVIQVGTQ